MGFAVPADLIMKIKESQKKGNYLDLARELKKLWNIKVTVIPVVIGTLSTIPQGSVRRLEEFDFEDEPRSFKLLHWWDRLEYREESWRLKEICCHSNPSERPSDNRKYCKE